MNIIIYLLSISVKILKENVDIFVSKILFDFNSSVDLGTLPNNFKLADE